MIKKSRSLCVFQCLKCGHEFDILYTKENKPKKK
jgi:hypothetical protein